MEKRKKYDFDLLQKYCSENNVTLLEDYKHDYLTKNFSIKGKCAYENCNNVFEVSPSNLTNPFPSKTGIPAESSLLNFINESLF